MLVGASNIMVWQFIAGLFGGGLLQGILAPIDTASQRASFNTLPTNVLSAASYADAYRYNTINGTMYYRYMRDLGYSPNQAKIFFNNTQVYLSKEDASIKRIANSFDTVFTH